MKIKLIVGFCILFAVVIINSCENKQASAPLAVVISNCDTTNLTFSSGPNRMDSLINIQCGASNAACHSPGSISGYDYTLYSTIYANYKNGWLYSTIFEGTPNAMPKTAQPDWTTDPCIKAKFKAWIDQGCPQ
jgi:hypothetical protein